MPSGGTHDRITLYSLPVIAGVTLWQTRSSNLTLLVASGFMFSGLMFGPDLDIYSRQFQRWGFLRCIWRPYQKKLRHRSVFSHGPIIGTIIRVIYLGCFLALVAIAFLLVGEMLGILAVTWQDLSRALGRSLVVYTTEYLALFLGLELGAMSHSLSDWGGSAYKRVQKQGVRSLFAGKKGRRRKGGVKRRGTLR
ncbi:MULTISPECIES: metal-binding protein [unclassified Nodularia (in: cyanobacteria)]|uniref:metal-binding protein n=1 Tax=unclassified Nodularia (in: cyanobacteria) TaxID=2656917 RepID=UPI0018828583|nr:MULTISPECIES: metal-binding protein [unclassified Nodularia (in: cyanobacteria)]MBE9199339.1 metal-binding protein [Nodularia sp. LEGE 06071]MCC2694145.1 metal-binding protein [Nodularia sp. LEGE 04288]